MTRKEKEICVIANDKELMMKMEKIAELNRNLTVSSPSMKAKIRKEIAQIAREINDDLTIHMMFA